jgi:1-phosphatidylinositol phosphodiesterase
MTVDMKDWMGELDDDLSLCRLTIPGTHDSCTANYQGENVVELWVKTQHQLLSDQLRSGIRFIDIRCRRVGDRFALVHNRFDLKLDFQAVLDVCLAFLRAHREETILMSIKEEGVAEGSEKTFAEIFNTVYLRETEISDRFYLGGAVPRLGEVRGRIVLFRRFAFDGFGDLGIDASHWPNNTTFTYDPASEGRAGVSMRIQDRYDGPTPAQKYELVKKMLDEAAANTGEMLYVNFSSATGLLSPLGFAAFINPPLKDLISDRHAKSCLGIVVMDFPPEGLIERLAGTNLGLERYGDSGDLAGDVSDLAAIAASRDVLVTAVRTKTEKLELITWSFGRLGPVRRLADSGDQAGEASELAIASGSLIVTALRTAAGRLRLVSWKIAPSGTSIARKGDSGDQAGDASQIAIAGMGPSLFVTACRTASGRLLLISWKLEADGDLKRLADSGDQAGDAGEISLCRVSGSRLVTAIRDGGRDLRLIAWAVSSSGALQRLGDTGDRAGEASRIQCVAGPDGLLISSCRDASHELKLITWRMVDGGKQIVRLADSGDAGGLAGDNALAALPGGAISGVRTSAGRLELIEWKVSASGKLARGGDSGEDGDKASLIQVIPGLAGVPDDPFVASTAARSDDGHLRIITWGPARMLLRALPLRRAS